MRFLLAVLFYGVEEASNVFFKKKARDVTINEAAYLAAILNAPSYFSPYGENLSALEERKDAILALMLNYGDITREEYIGAINEKTGFSSQARFSIKAPHFVFYVQQELENEYGNDLYQLEGSVITTSLDLNLQERIEGLVETTHKSLNNRIKGDNIAALVLSTKTGEILSLVGSKDFFNEEIDGRVNIINSYRQPGSTIKPLIYAAAFSKGLEPETILYDVATQFGPDCDEDDFTTNIEDGCYAPINFTQTFSGPISIRNALAQSINLPAVKTAYLTGLKNIQLFGREIGVSAFNKNVYDYGLSLALGSVDVKPFELAQIYSVFANEGFLVPHTWEKVEKIDSRKRKKVFEKDVAQKITSILTDNEARAPVFGRNSPLNITNIPVASKTGTTNNARDIWVVGYSPDIVVLVWFGNTDGSFIEGEAFGVLLSPLYRDIFTFASATHSSPNTYFSKDSTPTTQKGAPIIYGDLDTQSPHSILHYVDQKDFYKTPKTPEDNIQYPHWEFGVKNWLEENEIQEQESVVPLVEESPSITFNINNPRENIVSKENPLTLTANLIPILNTRYEFYVNGVLAGSSHLPIFIISPSQLVVGETLIRIVGVTPQGTYTTEKIHYCPISGDIISKNDLSSVPLITKGLFVSF